MYICIYFYICLYLYTRLSICIYTISLEALDCLDCLMSLIKFECNSKS